MAGRTASAVAETLWRVAYPEQCVGCGAVLELERRHFCPACDGKLSWIGEHACARCGSQVGPHATTRGGCAACRGLGLAFARTAAPFRYEGMIRDLILHFKLGGRPSLVYVLGDLLCDYLATGGVSQAADVIVPVPLHWRRRAARGYNQARLLALEIGARFHLPVAARALHRRRATRSQTALTALSRRANVRHAFAARSPGSEQSRLRRLWARASGAVTLLGRRVLLVDDVMTTCSTLNECARVLRRAGAAEVSVVVLARAHGRSSRPAP
ncbi:MAG: ComF family protein [bacterium]